MDYQHVVDAALIVAGIGIGWLTWDTFAQLLEFGKYRHRRRVVMCKVWDSEEPRNED
jgi:hypothetical protein